MKQIKFLSKGLVGALIFGSLCSCSHDDDDVGYIDTVVKPETVFTAGIPTLVNIMQVKTNAQGLVTDLTSWVTNYSFSYKKEIFQGKEYDATMTSIIDAPEYKSQRYYYLLLNEKGFVTYALEHLIDDRVDVFNEYWVEYNDDDQLNYVKYSYLNEETFVTYEDGDISKVVRVPPGEPEYTIYETSISYGNNPIPNKGCIMPFSSAFDINAHNLSATYYAGMLGKSTKHLPIEKRDLTGSKNYCIFDWTLNRDKLPTKVVYTHYDSEGKLTEGGITTTEYGW